MASLLSGQISREPPAYSSRLEMEPSRSRNTSVKAKAALNEIMNAEQPRGGGRRDGPLRRDLRSQVTPRRRPNCSKTASYSGALRAFPAEHWIHLRSTNAIESTFDAVAAHGQDQWCRQPGRRAVGLAMAYKLLDAAEQRWRSDDVDGAGSSPGNPRLLPLEPIVVRSSSK